MTSSSEQSERSTEKARSKNNARMPSWITDCFERIDEDAFAINIDKLFNNADAEKIELI